MTRDIYIFNNNNFSCVDQAQWCDKTKGLSNLVIVNNAHVADGLMKVLVS